MSHVLAKFKVKEVTQFETSISVKNADGKYEYQAGIGNRIKFEVVSGEKPENEVFAVWTPYGSMEMVITNPALVGHFKVGSTHFFKIIPEEEFQG